MKKVCLFTLTLLAASGVGLYAGDVTGTIKLNGTPPKELPTAQKENADCGKLLGDAPSTTHHYVVGKNGELANCVVVIKGASGGAKGDTAPPAILDQKKCTYVPQILAVQTGQKILVKNSDPVMHNVHTVPMVGANNTINTAQGPGAPDLTYTAAKAENFLKFQCDVHNWMFAWVSVFDHPYFAVTDENGKYTIKNVPDGNYEIQVFHRKAAPASAPKTEKIEVKGNVTKDFTLDVPAAK